MKTFRLLAITTLATITITAAWGNAEILPKICESGKNANFTIEVTNYNGPMQDLRILYISQDGKFLDGKYHHDRKAFEVLTPECTSGSKTLKLNNIKLNGEGIHTMQLAIKANTKPVEWKVIGKIPVYSLQPDLFALRPYKGDFHAHSKNSDGAGPGFSVFAYARRGGHDFMTLSDHRKYTPQSPKWKKSTNSTPECSPYPAKNSTTDQHHYTPSASTPKPESVTGSKTTKKNSIKCSKQK